MTRARKDGPCPVCGERCTREVHGRGLRLLSVALAYGRAATNDLATGRALAFAATEFAQAFDDDAEATPKRKAGR